MTAPRTALRTEAGASYVWVVTDGRLRRQLITLGRDVGDQVVVEQGLLGGEALVTGDPGDRALRGAARRDRLRGDRSVARRRVAIASVTRVVGVNPTSPALGEPRGPARGGYLAALALGALGVVYGDIGTSPLYALRECFHGEYAVAPTPGATCSACCRSSSGR